MRLRQPTPPKKVVHTLDYLLRGFFYGSSGFSGKEEQLSAGRTLGIAEIIKTTFSRGWTGKRRRAPGVVV